jgi:hypothetical protein
MNQTFKVMELCSNTQNKANKLNCRRKTDYKRLSGKAPETAAVLKAVSTTSYALFQ